MRRNLPFETKLVAYYSKTKGLKTLFYLQRLLLEIAMVSSTDRALVFKKRCIYNRKVGINVLHQLNTNPQY